MGCSSLGKPRRLSAKFLEEERAKLQAFREGMRDTYVELRTRKGKGAQGPALPPGLAPPLNPGQRVVAVHPATGRPSDGKVLTVDRASCRVQFDDPKLGVKLVPVRGSPTSSPPCFFIFWP